MYCTNCGKELKESDQYCPECGLKVENKKEGKKKATKVVDNITEEKQYVSGMKNDTLLCVISLVCMYGMGLINLALLAISNALPSVEGFISFLRGLSGLGPIAAWVLVIYARVHYKDSKFAKTLLIIYIIQAALVIVGVILLIATCANILHDCNSSSFGVIFNLLW